MSDGDAVFDQSDLPTFRKMAEVYTRLAAEEGDAGARMVHRIVAEVTTRLVAAMPATSTEPRTVTKLGENEHDARWTWSVPTDPGAGTATYAWLDDRGWFYQPSYGGGQWLPAGITGGEHGAREVTAIRGHFVEVVQ